MSLSMGIPMLMSGFSGLSKLFGPIAAAIGTMSWSIDKNTKSTINNYLANNNPETSNYTIGWHPNFEQLLSEVENDDERD